MSRIGYYDNAERRTTFRDLLKMYDVYGQRAMIMHPIDVTGTLVDQRGHGPGAIFILQLDEKIMFTDYLNRIGIDTPGSPKAMALFDDFNRLGFIESYLKPIDYDNSRITHLWAQWKDVILIDMQRGQPVEYVESESTHVASIKSTPGIVQNVVKGDDTLDVIELFLVHPVSWVRIPRAMDTDYLKPEHISSWTDRMVVRSTYLNWKEKYPDSLPAGHISTDGKEYVLASPIPLDQVKGICSSTLTDKERILRCWLGAAMFHVVPIVIGHTGRFRPMRMEVARESIPYVVTRADVDDAMRRGEHFENNPIYPSEWENGNFDPSNFYKLPELKKDTIKTLMSFNPKDIQVEPGTYSIVADTIASGSLGINMPSRIVKILGLGDVHDYDEDVNESTKWNDYEFAWDIIDEHTEKIAEYVNDNIDMPGEFRFGTSEHDGDYVLEYVFSEGDYPEFDARR